MAVHERLKGIRVKSGMTQEAFGKAVGVSTNTQIRYEKGHRHPDTEYLRAVSQKFSVDFNWLISGDEPRTEWNELSLDQLEVLRAQFTQTFGMTLGDFDDLLIWLQAVGSQSRLNSHEQSLLNAYRSTDHYGKKALEAVAAVVHKGNIEASGAVQDEVWGVGSLAHALRQAIDSKTRTKVG